MQISMQFHMKSALTFFTPYSSSVGGFNTTSIVPYISIPLSFGNTWLYEQLARCIYLKRVDKSRKILFFKPLLDFSHPMVVPWGVSTRSPQSRIQPYLQVSVTHRRPCLPEIKFKKSPKSQRPTSPPYQILPRPNCFFLAQINRTFVYFRLPLQSALFSFSLSPLNAIMSQQSHCQCN